MLGGDAVVGLGEERLDDLLEGARARVQDRDPALLGVDRVGEQPVQLGEVRVRRSPTRRWNVSRESAPMFSRKTPGRDRFDPSSNASPVTIVAKFGQCDSSSEKNVAPSAWAMTVSG